MKKSDKQNRSRLSKPATLNQYVQPVALPIECAPPGTMCQASGWGNTKSYWDDSGRFLNQGKITLDLYYTYIDKY